MAEFRKIQIKKPGYSTRTTQSILQYGVGAMVDFPDQTLMTSTTKLWKHNVKEIHDPRLEDALDVDFFGMPGETTDNPDSREGISYVRFPEWYFCPVCRRFKPLKEWKKEYDQYAAPRTKERDPYMVQRLRCYKCKGYPELVASGIVIACKNGHIDDFPWIEWAHVMNKPSITSDN